MTNFMDSFDALPVVTRGTMLMDLAWKNIAAVASHTQDETLDYLAKYERVSGVWIETEKRNDVFIETLKGPPDHIEAIETAIPCKNREDARRWAILLNTPRTDKVRSGIALVEK